MNYKEVFNAFDIVFSVQGWVEQTFNTGLKEGNAGELQVQDQSV